MNEAIVLTGILIFIFGGFFLLNKFYRNRPVVDDQLLKGGGQREPLF